MVGTVSPGDPAPDSLQAPGPSVAVDGPLSTAVETRRHRSSVPRPALAPPPPLRVRLLGPGVIQVGSTTLADRNWPRRQSRSILLLLLGTPGHRLPRDVVLEAIWPNQDLEPSLNALYKALHALRRTLEPELDRGRTSFYIDVGRETIALHPHEGLWVDVDHFDHLLLQAERETDPRETLRAALALYRGEFMHDEPYADWPVPRRESLRAAHRRATLTLARLDREHGDPMASLGFLESLLVEDPAFEDAHRAIIQALLATGQRSLALQQVERCRLALQRDLGMDLDPETEALARAARQVAVQAPALPGAAPIDTRHNVPGIPTPTVGRQVEIARVAQMLNQPGTRMVTLVGTGGVGKTRLAIEVAHRASAAFANGVAFVDLATVRDVSMVFRAVATAMQVREGAETDLRTVVLNALRGQPQYLLVLDNLEHLQGVDRVIADLLADVPTVRVLGTSRQPVRIRAERLYRLEPLPVPDIDESDTDRVRSNASVALFLQCVQAWGGEEQLLIPANRLTLAARICQRLDGLPLAIELAAARCWDTSLQTVLAQLDSRLQLPGTGPADLPARHRTLAATIGWSYDLLTPGEQSMFRGLAVFAGGIEVDALEGVFGPGAMATAGSLVSKSLLRRSQRYARTRLDMLESVREYAELKLRDHGEERSMRRTHATFFAHLLPTSGSSRTDDGQLEWVRRIEREHDNIHLALTVGLDQGQSGIALRLISGMGLHWFTHGCAGDVRQWIRMALAIEPAEPSEDRAWAALWGSVFCWRMADAVGGERFEQQARATWERLGSAHGVSRVDHAVGIRLGVAGQFNQALRLHQSTLPVFEREGDIEGIIFSHSGMAHVLGLTGSAPVAVQHLDEALAVARDAGDLAMQSFVLARLPMLLATSGEHQRALEMNAESERIVRLIGDRRALPWASMVRAMLATAHEDHHLALEQAQVALSGFQEAGDSLNEWLAAMHCAAAAGESGQLDLACRYAQATLRGVQAPSDRIEVLLHLASLVLALGHPDDALVAYVAGFGAAGQMGIVVPAANQRRFEAGMTSACNQLTPQQVRAARMRGGEMGVDDALDVVWRRVSMGEAPVRTQDLDAEPMLRA